MTFEFNYKNNYLASPVIIKLINNVCNETQYPNNLKL